MAPSSLLFALIQPTELLHRGTSITTSVGPLSVHPRTAQKCLSSKCSRVLEKSRGNRAGSSLPTRRGRSIANWLCYGGSSRFAPERPSICLGEFLDRQQVRHPWMLGSVGSQAECLIAPSKNSRPQKNRNIRGADAREPHCYGIASEVALRKNVHIDAGVFLKERQQDQSLIGETPFLEFKTEVSERRVEIRVCRPPR